MSFLPQCFRQFRRLNTGNVTMMFALGAPLLAMGVAVAVDYTNHTIIESKLRGAADAAALAALTPTMLKQPAAVAQAAATAMFNARASAVTSLIAGDTQVNVIITTDPKNPLMRDVEVDYSAQAATIFTQVLNVSSMGVVGVSKAEASVPPNINFYLLLDNSPSMLLPSTADGITKMVALTPLQDGGNGCAFACHQSSTNNLDTIGNPCIDGSIPSVASAASPNSYCPTTANNANTQIDNLALARANQIDLRLDDLSAAVGTLVQTAWGKQTSGQWPSPPVYQFAAYQMDMPATVGLSNYLLMDLTPNYVGGWSSAATNFGSMEMYANNQFCSNPPSCDSGTQTLNGSTGVQDAATNYDTAMSDINAKMPDPGNGSNQPGDKPQETLFFVTDGVEDEETGGGRLIQTINGGTSTDYCSLIKARGIKIAILYTQYLAVPANTFYQENVAPIINNVGPALQACATPGLFVQAAIGDNLSTDLLALFQLSTQPAALSN